MKTCQTIERILLLSASGEGPSPLPRHVQAHLQQCAAMRGLPYISSRARPAQSRSTCGTPRASCSPGNAHGLAGSGPPPKRAAAPNHRGIAHSLLAGVLLAAGLVLRSISSQEKASIGHEDARLAEAHLLGDEEIALLGLVLLSWENDIDFFMSMLFDGSDDDLAG